MTRPSSRAILSVLLAGVFVLCAGYSAAPAGEMEPPMDLREHGRREALVDEPVFHGQAYIYEAGLQHELSVVLIHGVGDRGARDWERLIPELEAQYHVVAFDLPGFGRSDKRNELYTPTRYAEFVKWVIGRTVKGPFVLIGHSFGGVVALRYAARYPENMQRLILVDVPGILHRVAYARYMSQITPWEWQSKLPLDPLAMLNGVTRTLLVNFERESMTNDLRGFLDRSAMRKTVLGSDPKKIAAIALVLEDFSQAIDRMRVPTLVIWGENDTIAPLRTGKVLAQGLPFARLEIIGKAGHVPMLEQPKQFNRTVTREIASLPGKWPDPPAMLQQSQSDRIGVCYKTPGMSFTGNYGAIVICDCEHVRIEEASIGRLDVTNSDVVIENSRISGDAVSLKTFRSELTLTNVIVEGDTAIRSSRSRLDLAGVRLVGKTDAVSVKEASTLVFSVSHVESPHTTGTVHGTRRIIPNKPL